MAYPILKLYTEWGINLKNSKIKAVAMKLKSKLWFNIFLKVSFIFLIFIIILSFANKAFLSDFYFYKQEKLLVSQMQAVAKLDFSDKTTVTAKLSEISEKYNFEAEIYSSDGQIIYTTKGSQMMDYFSSGHFNFSMAHEEMKIISVKEKENGIKLATGVSRFSGEEFLVCSKALDGNVFAELRIRRELVLSSAQTANEFIAIIALFCFVVSMIWIFVFARKFSKPIAQMSEITKDMSELKFDRKLLVEGNDEIGRLAFSINEMSDSLSASLDELNESNAKLRDEIELERQLDVMRREFVANVSHELKTPLAIINGYAEGLKLNINEDAKEQYLNTIIDEGQRMNRLVISLLELSRYESGQIPLNIQSFDISVMSEDILKRIFSDTSVKTENLLPEGLIIRADPLQIEQVFKSYLENAKAHTQADGNVKIFHRITEDNTVRICVYNSGSRVEQELMPQIWQSFYRGDTSHKREKSRFGLGLSIVGAICKLHGKACGVYNADDGVCFWFECDLSEQNENSPNLS